MSKTIPDLTIAIVTNRPSSLKLCLKSIHLQTLQPQKILLFKQNKLSIPQKRNLAIKKCQTKYLAFVDDDCILDKNWVKNGYQFALTHPKASYIVGKTKLQNSHNLLAKVQFYNYQNWFNQNYPLDTKNVILNLSLIKDLHFDPQFKIFEDVDFNQQLISNNLFGIYCSNMWLYHNETTGLIDVIKKNFTRGQYKSRINTKWGNFDNFTPTIPPFTNILDFILNFSFNLGYLYNPPKLITVVNSMDQGANQQRLLAFQNFFASQNYTINTIDSLAEFNKVISSRKSYLLYHLSLLKYMFWKNCYESFHDNFSMSQLFIATMQLRQKIIHRLLVKNYTSLAIIQYPEDMLAVLTKNRSYATLYDSPTILYRELELGKLFSNSIIKLVKQIETKVYQSSNFVSFHWYTYFNIAQKLRLEINHPIYLNWGCRPINSICQYSPRPKIVYLGILNSYWVNPELLINLSKIYSIDVYSYQKPDPKFYPKNSINYRGFLNNINDLSKYQFGLITISQDNMRRNGFSAKYLDYLSCGLPVLCPEWRHDKLLSPATISFNISNFKKQIKKYSQLSHWQTKSDKAVSLSKKLSWNKTLLPLLKVVTHSIK